MKKSKKDQKRILSDKDAIAWIKLCLKLTPYERLLLLEKMNEAYYEGISKQTLCNPRKLKKRGW